MRPAHLYRAYALLTNSAWLPTDVESSLWWFLSNVHVPPVSVPVDCASRASCQTESWVASRQPRPSLQLAVVRVAPGKRSYRAWPAVFFSFAGTADLDATRGSATGMLTSVPPP